MKKQRWLNLAFQLSALVLALGFTTLILLATDTDPWQAYKYIIIGSIGSLRKFSDVLVSFIPLLLVSSGLLVTFSAGLWNIGVEGQITLGAIATTWVLRLLQDSSLPPGLIIALAMLAGMLGGAIWASLAGALKTYGGVNEIFGGLGLNFVATALTLWLIFGPWKRPGIGSMSGTEPFPDYLVAADDPRTPSESVGAWDRYSIHCSDLFPAERNPLRIADQGGRQEYQSRLPAWCSDHPLSHAGLHPGWRSGRFDRRHSGDGCLPSPDPVHFQWIRISGFIGGHAGEFPGHLGGSGGFILRCFEYWQYPITHRVET